VAEEVAAIGRRALPMPLDLADEAQLLASVSGLIEILGGVDVLVNAAGTDVPGPVEDLTAEDWDRVLGVNLRAPFLLAKAVFSSMRERGRGTIVNVSSVAGKRGWANASAYCASKFGLTGLTQALAAEGKPHGIRACVLYPGAMATSWGVWSAAARETEQREPQPPSEALPPSEVAALIVWIATAPPELVLTEAVVSPLLEQGWP
jgi:NAD(P)-dependent dehydrogenase (short-subunit alcohol dehydrogenase family)